MNECNNTKDNPEYFDDKYVPVDAETTSFWNKVYDSVKIMDCKDISESPECKKCVCQYNRLRKHVLV